MDRKRAIVPARKREANGLHFPYANNIRRTFVTKTERSDSSALSRCSLSFWIVPQARSSGLAPRRSVLPNIMVHKSVTSCTV